MSLWKKLMVSYVIVIIIPLLLLTFLSYTHVSKTLIQQFQYSSDMSLHQTRIYLDRILDEIIGSTEQIVFNKTLSEIHDKNGDSGKFFSNFEDFQTTFNLMNDIFISDALYSVELYVDGSYTLKDSHNGNGIYFINSDNQYAKELKQNLTNFRGELLWFPPRDVNLNFTHKKTSFITGARYIKSMRTNKNIGIVTVNIEQQYLNNIIGHSSILSDSVSLLLDKNGHIIALSDNELFQSYEIPPKLILENIAENKSSLRVNNETMLLNFTPTIVSDWTLVTLIPYDEMLTTSTETRNNMFLIMLGISMLFFLVAYLISKLLTKRIQFLANRMKEVQLNNYSLISPVQGTDEISELNNSYNHLLNKINDYANTQYQLGIELKNSELKALQAQINPHFLYNTLDMLHWIAQDYGADEISEIVSLLSKYYKLSLSNGVDVVSVKDAIKHIEVYVKLQNFRFDNSIQLILNIDPQMNNYGILKLLLQPIVENAILHGIQGKDDQAGTITITGNLSNNLLYFTITDNGIGMNTHQIENLTKRDTIIGGYGIKNVIQRIQLYYGAEYGLQYHSEPGEGTTVLLRVPCLDI